MATTLSRTAYVQALPTFSVAAELIGIDPSGITRAVDRLGIQPEMWGGREKHLRIRDLMQIASEAQRASLEEVAGGLVEWVEREQPEAAEQVAEEVDLYLEGLPAPEAAGSDAFITELRTALPKRWAEQAERIYRYHLRSS